MAISRSSFDYIRTLLAERSAIAIDGQKVYLVETRLLPVARRAGLSSIDELVKRLRVTTDDQLQQQIVDAMTTNETSFFRDRVPFETLRAEILPDLLARRGLSKQLNIWSAACASGQEPYSIAMLLSEHFSHLRDWHLRLLGTDLSTEAVERARRGRFTQLEIERGLPPALARKYFHRVGDDWQIDESIGRIVEFRQFNLGGSWAALPKMDLILLRNVLVYFDAETRKKILGKVRRLLRPDGYLLLGGAETSLHIDSAFTATRGDGFSYYRLKDA
jgi:chemotaxis protein methyltransferase CheR